MYFNYKHTDSLKLNKWKLVFHAKYSYLKSRMVILIWNKVGFKTRMSSEIKRDISIIKD